MGCELDKLDKADIAVVYFHPSVCLSWNLYKCSGKGYLYLPQNSLEGEKCVSCVKKFGVEMVENVDGLREAVMKRCLLLRSS